MKSSCWQVKKCGREPGGYRVDELGVCPAASDSSYDGFNHGQNGGRICWAVAGTLCKGEIQGIFALKIDDCVKCAFFKKVAEEEGAGFVLHPDDQGHNCDVVRTSSARPGKTNVVT